MTGEGKTSNSPYSLTPSKFTANRQNLKQKQQQQNPSPSVILSILTYFLPVSVIYILSVSYYYSSTEITRPWKFWHLTRGIWCSRRDGLSIYIPLGYFSATQFPSDVWRHQMQANTSVAHLQFGCGSLELWGSVFGVRARERPGGLVIYP